MRHQNGISFTQTGIMGRLLNDLVGVHAEGEDLSEIMG